jgi:hypothetical protein
MDAREYGGARGLRVIRGTPGRLGRADSPGGILAPFPSPLLVDAASSLTYGPSRHSQARAHVCGKDRKNAVAELGHRGEFAPWIATAS